MRSQHRKATLNIPTLLDLQNQEWDVILKSWAYINFKYIYLYKHLKIEVMNQLLIKVLLQIKKSSIQIQAINYKVCSSMPNIIEVKTETINLQKYQKDYIKLLIKAPLTPCKLHVKIALMDIKGDTVFEGMEFDLIISNIIAR